MNCRHRTFDWTAPDTDEILEKQIDDLVFVTCFTWDDLTTAAQDRLREKAMAILEHDFASARDGEQVGDALRSRDRVRQNFASVGELVR